MSNFIYALYEGFLIYQKRKGGLWRYVEDDKVVEPQPSRI